MKALGFCLGTGYSEEVDLAWKKIFSATVQIVVPAAILEEEAMAKEKQHEKDEDLPDSLKAVVFSPPTSDPTPTSTVRTVATSASAPVLATVPTPEVVASDVAAVVSAPEATSAVVAPVPEGTPAVVV